MMCGVAVATGAGDAVGSDIGFVESDPHAVVPTRKRTVSPRRDDLVLVTRVVVAGVIVPIVAVIVRRVVMASMGIEAGRRRSSRLLVAVRLIDIGVGMSRVIVAERDTFEVARRPSNSIGLTESNIVRRLTFEYEIR